MQTKWLGLLPLKIIRVLPQIPVGTRSGLQEVKNVIKVNTFSFSNKTVIKPWLFLS